LIPKIKNYMYVNIFWNHCISNVDILYKNFKKLWLSILFIDSIELTFALGKKFTIPALTREHPRSWAMPCDESARVRNKSRNKWAIKKNEFLKVFPDAKKKKLTGEAAIYFKSYFLKVFVQTIGATCRLIDLIRSKDTIPTGTRGWEVPGVRSGRDYDESLVVFHVELRIEKFSE